MRLAASLTMMIISFIIDSLFSLLLFVTLITLIFFRLR